MYDFHVPFTTPLHIIQDIYVWGVAGYKFNKLNKHYNRPFMVLVLVGTTTENTYRNS